MGVHLVKAAAAPTKLAIEQVIGLVGGLPLPQLVADVKEKLGVKLNFKVIIKLNY